MTISQTPFLAEISAGHFGPPIPAPTRAYFQQRLRNRVFQFILKKFISAQEDGLSKAILARRIGKTPDLINRWLGAPSNLTLDSVSDLLLGIASEEIELSSSSPVRQKPHNYSLFNDEGQPAPWVEQERAKARFPPPSAPFNPLGIPRHEDANNLETLSLR